MKRPLKYFHQFAYYAMHCPHEDDKITTFAMHSAASNKAFNDPVIVAVCTECETRYEATAFYDATATPVSGYTLGVMTREVAND